MKIQVVSDLHLEFGTISIENTGADTLILSGDICLANELNDRDNYNVMGEQNRSSVYHTFFQECSARFKNVIYISGNHEHYHGDIAKSHDRLKEKLAYLKNIHILECESIYIDGITFVAGTLWTDMNREDPVTLNSIKGVMNDYRIIDDSDEMVQFKKAVYKKDEQGNLITQKVGEINSTIIDHYETDTRPSKFSPEKSVVRHKCMLSTINEVLESAPVDAKIVIVGHHAPCKMSTKPRYQNEVIMNGAYSSDLTELMLDNPKIKLWTHGHTHSSFDYMIGSTRIVCNPRGYYSYEENEEFDPGKIIEV
jgi:predicted phosphodiesterase